MKFTKDGGAVTFDARFLPGADPRHLTARYCVKNTGIGIGEDFLAHLFDDFAQEESQARTQYKGSGLGLAISKHYVDMMGGVISVTSSKGKGSEFTVELPLEAADAPAAHEVPVTSARPHTTEPRDLNSCADNAEPTRRRTFAAPPLRLSQQP